MASTNRTRRKKIVLVVMMLRAMDAELGLQQVRVLREKGGRDPMHPSVLSGGWWG